MLQIRYITYYKILPFYKMLRVKIRSLPVELYNRSLSQEFDCLKLHIPLASLFCGKHLFCKQKIISTSVAFN